MEDKLCFVRQGNVVAVIPIIMEYRSRPADNSAGRFIPGSNEPSAMLPAAGVFGCNRGL